MSKKDNWDYVINHLGEDREYYHGATVPPIFQTSNFVFEDVGALAQAFADEMGHHLYTRGNNPTVKILREKCAALEKTEDALIFSSGSAAMNLAILSQLGSGDHVISVCNPYAWTHRMLTDFLTRFGVETTFVGGDALDEIQKALRPNTKLLVLESPNSLTFEIQNLKALSKWAGQHQVTTIVDNSYASPLFQNPADFGIDIVVHSGTKYINGHSDVVCGIVCSSGKIIEQIFKNEYMTLGAIISPYEAALILRGMRTLKVRMRQIAQSTRLIFEFLRSQPWVEKIYYPGDPAGKHYKLAKTQMSGFPGLISFEAGSKDEGHLQQFADQLEAFKMAVSWGGHESLILPMLALHKAYPATAHRLPHNFFRIYVGLEDPEYLIRDLALAARVFL